MKLSGKVGGRQRNKTKSIVSGVVIRDMPIPSFLVEKKKCAEKMVDNKPRMNWPWILPTLKNSVSPCPKLHVFDHVILGIIDSIIIIFSPHNIKPIL